MRVLILSPYPESIIGTVKNFGDNPEVSMEPITSIPETDFIVSYGYRHIIREPVLSVFKDRLINLHISLLPWNRGADPNFWSWFDNTPKGVTIHQIDKGLDAGPILTQKVLSQWGGETLATSWKILRDSVEHLFNETWPLIKRGGLKARPNPSYGTYHRSSHKTPYWNLLPNGYDSSCRDVEALGKTFRRL